MICKITDSTLDVQVQQLIQEVFDFNNISYSASDYAVVKVEDMLVSVGPQSNDSYLFLAPLTTSSALPPLRLPYKRKEIELAMQGLHPYFYDADETTVARDVIAQVNASLNGVLVLKENDFYDTCIVTDNGSIYIVLFAHPRSLFFRGSFSVPQRSRTEPFYLSFCVKLTSRHV